MLLATVDTALTILCALAGINLFHRFLHMYWSGTMASKVVITREIPFTGKHSGRVIEYF